MASYGKVINDVYSKRVRDLGSTEVWDEVQVSDATNSKFGGPVVNIATPIFLGDKIIGGVRVGLSLQDLNKDIAIAKTKLSEISQFGINELLSATLAATLILILCGAFFSILLAGWLSTPISKLAHATTEIGKGQFSIDIPDLGKSELGELASSIKTMSSQRQAAEEELSRSEARLKYLLSSGHAVIFAKDTTTKHSTTYVSSNISNLLGYSEEDVLNDPEFWTDHIHPDDLKYVDVALTDAKLGDRGMVEYKLRRADGEYRRMREEFILSAGEKGRPPEFIGSLTDVTAQRIAEEDLQRHQKAETIGNMTSGIAHNLNNLMQPILTLSYLAKLDLPVGSPQYENMDVIEQAGTRAAELIRRVMMFSREGQIFHDKIDVCEIVNETLNLLDSTLPSSIKLNKILDPATGFANLDGVQFQTVLMNMAANSIYAMQGKTGTMTFILSREHLSSSSEGVLSTLISGQYAKLSINDSGRGMTPETLGKIFDPFFTTKEVGEGTGLGLSTAYGNIRSMGGVINVSSELGVGTTFDIYIPLLDEDASPSLI